MGWKNLCCFSKNTPTRYLNKVKDLFLSLMTVTRAVRPKKYDLRCYSLVTQLEILHHLSMCLKTKSSTWPSDQNIYTAFMLTNSVKYISKRVNNQKKSNDSIMVVLIHRLHEMKCFMHINDSHWRHKRVVHFCLKSEWTATSLISKGKQSFFVHKCDYSLIE